MWAPENKVFERIEQMADQERRRRAFAIWLAIMVPTIIVLTIVGLTCSDCQLPPY